MGPSLNGVIRPPIFEPFKKLVSRRNQSPRGFGIGIFMGCRGGRMPVARGLHSCEQAAPHVHSCPRYFNVSAIIPVFLLRLVHLRIWGLQVQVLSGAPVFGGSLLEVAPRLHLGHRPDPYFDWGTGARRYPLSYVIEECPNCS